MDCPNCGHANAADARFCSQCGTALAVSCPICSTVAAPGSKFCSNCGSSLEAQRAITTPHDDLTRYVPKELLAKLRSAEAGDSMRGERRTATILFADIKGSTAAAERLDPEDWATIVNGAFEHMIAPVYRFEGTLSHLQGDGLHAIFGAPIAHEDDPVRAVRAGLAILDAVEGYSSDVEARWGFPLEVRVGVNTGLVVVGEVGSDLRVEYTALGDAINVAARMEQTAEPGTVQVTRETLARTGNMFESQSLGPIQLKGKAEPVEAFRILRFVGGRSFDGARPLVGRTAELARFASLKSRLMSGSGWMASVMGEAGAGKSRLVTEFRALAANDLTVAERYDSPGDVFWLSGQGRSYDQSSPYALMREVLWGWLGDAWSTPSLESLVGAVEKAALDDPDATGLLGFIADVELPEETRRFLSALETPTLQSRATEVFVAFVSALTRDRPGFVVLEDLHWADDLSLALTEELMDLAETMPIGLVFAMRPYREDPSWRVHEIADRDHPHRYTSIELGSLNESESGDLIESLLDEQSISSELRKSILERADGNPLFIEEMVNSLAEDRAAGATVPNSLAGILTARLDRLDEQTRFLVQMASVLGSEFRRETLEAISGRAEDDRRLIDLFRRGIMVDQDSGWIGFRHALIQETAYSTILIRNRRELHQRVADYLIAERPDDVQDIARHLAEADLEKAFPYLIEAATLASRSMALADAIRLFTTAIENVPAGADPELIERAHTGLGEAYSLVPDLTQAAASYQELYAYGEKVNRPSTRVAALNSLGYTTAAVAFDLEGAAKFLEEARELAVECGDEIGLAQYHMNSCFVASMAGRLDTAVEHDEQTVVLGEKSGVETIRLSGLVRRATNYALLLDHEKGPPALEVAIRAAEEVQREDQLADLRATGVLFILARGDVAGALTEAEAVQPTLERYRSYFAGVNRLHIGLLKFVLGDLEGALAEYVETRRVAERFNHMHALPAASAALAATYAALGLTDPVVDLRASALQALEMPTGDFLASTVWAELGFAALLSDNNEAAKADFTSGVESSSTAHYLEQGRLLAGRALARIRLDELDDAQSDLDGARDAVTKHQFRFWDGLIAYAGGLLLEARGHREAADDALANAGAIAGESGGRLLRVQILQARSRLAHQLGDSSTTTEFANAAHELIDEIASTITDESLREAFAARWKSATPVSS